MADRVSLENLIEGLAGAVVEAQRRIETRQIENIRSFFDKHDRPINIDIRVPSLDPRAGPGEDELYRVPLLPLVASSLLRIKEVEISFDADLVGLTEEGAGMAGEPGEEKQGDGSPGAREARKSVGVDVRGGLLKRKGGAVHVVLKVEGRELSEGMARLVDRLIRCQGTVRPPEE